MEEYIKKYFDLITTNLVKHLEKENFPSDEKEKVNVRLELINELRYNITWQFKSEEQKQVSRLHWLATMRRSDMPYNFIHKQEKVIHIYEQIKSTLPYLEALNSKLLKTTIISFVNDLCDEIDLAGKEFKKDFPLNKETKEIFKPYYEIIKPAKGNGNMFEECYEKIDNLYNELLKLNETA
jgi:hypothetical protein